MTPNLWTVEAIVERMKAEITADLESGRVPAKVASFADLHDYVDANEYGGLCSEECPFDAGTDADADIINRAQEIVDRWLQTRGPLPTPWELVKTDLMFYQGAAWQWNMTPKIWLLLTQPGTAEAPSGDRREAVILSVWKAARGVKRQLVAIEFRHLSDALRVAKRISFVDEVEL